MPQTIITAEQAKRRAYWVAEIKKLSGNFSDDFDRLDAELTTELASAGLPALLSHLRLCGAIPEIYGHSSSEEKLYSKYTDAVLSHAFKSIGLTSIVLSERGDSADVECFADEFSFVADAKAFRLSRTAKNQKDIKVSSMDTWKRGKPYAVVVCPVYQLPARASQIYQQAIARDVCVFSYSHLAVIVQLAEEVGGKVAIETLKNVLSCIAALNPSKDATQYWQAINRAMLTSHSNVQDLWKREKLAALESIALAKNEALTALAEERERIMRMSHADVLKELIRKSNFTKRENKVKKVGDVGIFEMV